MIALSGQLNQCWAREVRVNGVPATYTIANPDGVGASWSYNFTLTPGMNHITVQTLNRRRRRDRPGRGGRLLQPAGNPARQPAADLPAADVQPEDDDDRRRHHRHRRRHRLEGVGSGRNGHHREVARAVSGRHHDDATSIRTSPIRTARSGSTTAGEACPSRSTRVRRHRREHTSSRSTVNGMSASRNFTVIQRPRVPDAVGNALRREPDVGTRRGDPSDRRGLRTWGSTLTINPGTLMMIDPGAVSRAGR